MTKSRNCICRVALAAALIVAARTATAEFTTVINVPPDTAPRGIDSNTQLNVFAGGSISSTYSSPFRAGGSSQSTNVEVNIFGGTVGDRFHANNGSVVNISGGLVGYGLKATAGSQVNISGGVVDRGFDAYAGSELTLSGGTIGRGFDAQSGTQVTLVGGEFKLNGAYTAESAVVLSDEDVLSGILADGSPFIFSAELGDRLREVSLSRVSTPQVDLAPIVVNSEVAPHGIRDGQTLTLEEGGILPEHFVAVNATLNILGGYVNGLGAIGSQVNIGGGEIVGLDSFEAFYGTHVIFCGGGVRPGFGAHDGSEVTVVSGVIGDNLDANFGSKVTITGGEIDGSVYAYSGSEITLVGKEFLLDGQPVAELSAPGDTHILESRDWNVLSGTLSDGTPFGFDTTKSRQTWYFSPLYVVDEDALLRLTLAIPGDYNNNGQVEQGDLDLVLTNWGHNMAALSSGWIASAPDGPIDQQELDAVLLNWGSGAPLGAASGVPEPSGLLIVALICSSGLALHRPGDPVSHR